MKKIILGVCVLLAAGLAFFFLRPHGGNAQSRAAELLPPETLLFAHVSDWPRTMRRWDKTALSEIWREPEMVGFREKPLRKLTATMPWLKKFDELQQIEPREAFMAVTTVDGPTPQFVAGVSYSGSRSRLEEMLKEARAGIKAAHPAGKTDLVTHGGVEIVSFSDKDLAMVEVFREDWYFCANDLELLKRTMDRYERKGPVGNLAASDLFKRATAELPADGDVLLFAQPGALMKRASALMAASGVKADPTESLKDILAVVASTKLEGAQFRDTIFVLKQEKPTMALAPLPVPLARHSLAATTPATVMYYVGAVPAAFELPEAASGMAALLLPALEQMEQALAAKGLKWSDLGKAFGPEIGVVVDWPQTAMQPVALLVLDVRERQKAQAFVEAMTTVKTGGAAWIQTPKGNATLYSAPLDDLAVVSPSLAFSDKFLVFGMSQDAVVAGLDRIQAGGATLATNPEFERATKALQPATETFAYVDLRTTFDRAYGTMRPLIGMAVAFSPDAAQYVDAGKLPGTDTVARHLGPMVFSQSAKANGAGMLLESTGPVTINQAVVAMAAGALAAALPNLKNMTLPGMAPGQFQPPAIIRDPVAPPADAKAAEKPAAAPGQ